MTTAIALAAIAAAVVGGWLFYASYCIGSGIYLRAACRLKTKDKEERAVAITFDDGPSANTWAVLDILDRHGAKAAFFLIGEKAREMPQEARAIAERGHQIGNHSLTHSGMFPLKSPAQIAAEIEQTQEIIAQATGQRPKLFRPPFGVTNPLIKKGFEKAASDGARLKAIGWDIRSFDTTAKDAQRPLERIRQRLHPGAIILLHDRVPFAPQLLEMLLEMLEEEGYEVREIEEG